VPDALAAWGRLLRVSLAPTAVADVVAGLVIAGAALQPTALVPQPGTAGLLVLASLCVYHGGMALNDWADRRHDAEVRADRPIPSGRIPAGLALAVALALLVAGPLVAWQIAWPAGAWVAGLAVAAASYDLFGRGPWLGPLLLALCRAGNLSIGFLALTEAPGDLGGAWSLPALYGVYVFLVSRLGRLEDGEERRPGVLTPPRLLGLLAGAFWILPFAPLPGAGLLGRGVALLLGIGASVELLRLARHLRVWTPPELLPAMGCALRRLLVFSAAAAALPASVSGGATNLVVVAGILALYPVSYFLRGIFPPS